MSFLDNLENSLKTLETSDERGGNASERRESERKRTLAAAPWADRLKTSEYTKTLFEKSAVAGHKLRAKIYLAWVGTTLRLEVRSRVLELQPGKDGVVAKYTTRAGQDVQKAVNLDGDPQTLLDQWLEGEEPTQRRVVPENWDEEEAQAGA